MKNTVVCGCDPQTHYECGGMYKTACPYTISVGEANMELCSGRHEIGQATDGAIFAHEIADPMNAIKLYVAAKKRLDPLRDQGMKVLNLYVTGMSTALVTVINYCHRNNVTLVTWHYDKSRERYVDFPIF